MRIIRNYPKEMQGYTVTRAEVYLEGYCSACAGKEKISLESKNLRDDLEPIK